MTKLFRDGEQIHSCQGLEMVEGKRGVGVTIKGQHEGGLCGDVIVLYPDCSGGYTPDKIELDTYTVQMSISWLGHYMIVMQDVTFDGN